MSRYLRRWAWFSFLLPLVLSNACHAFHFFGSDDKASYSDDFGSNSLDHYDYFMNSSQAATSASGAGYSIADGSLQVVPDNTRNHGGLASVKASYFPADVSNYVVEADFKMDNYATGLGAFGISFRTGPNGSMYCFQWNGNFGNANGGQADWEIEKNPGAPHVAYSFPKCCATEPGYVLGKWIHLKVKAVGNNFKCYVDPKDGTGDHLVFDYTDTGSPYTRGGVGIRTYGIANPNICRIRHFSAKALDDSTVETKLAKEVGSPSPAPSTARAIPSSSNCVTYYKDAFGFDSLGNYDYFINSTQSITSASGAGYVITDGNLEVVPTDSRNHGGLAVVKGSFLSPAITDYTVESDFKMDSYSTGLGAFGVAFRTGSNGSMYCFQWNGNIGNADHGTADWEIEKNSGFPNVKYFFPACCATTPAYTLGSWVHLKVVSQGDHFKCYANINDGTGDYLVFDFTDTTDPYASGGVGIRTYGIAQPNVCRIGNLKVSSTNCP